MGVLRSWIERYGVPRALYTDWKNVYVRAATEAEKCAGQVPVTQFGRMCGKLGIRIIAASSPQAKGRVERVHGTHQDRLVKKLRLAGVASYDACQSLSGGALYRRAQPALRTAGGGGSRLSPATTHGAATGPSVLAGGGAGGE